MRIRACSFFVARELKMAELFLRGRKISDLKLVEIRDELVKRNLPKKGNKASILKRLEKALLQEKLHEVSPPEGHDIRSVADKDKNDENQSSQSEEKAGECLTSEEPIHVEKTAEVTLKAQQDTSVASLTDPMTECISGETSSSEIPEAAASTSLKPVKTFVLNVEDARKMLGHDDAVFEGEMETEEAVDSCSGENPHEVGFSMDLDEESVTEEDITSEAIISTTTIAADTPVQNSGSIGSIEPSYPPEEELMYTDEEENDDLIFSVNTKELDLDESQEVRLKSPTPRGRSPFAKKVQKQALETSSCNIWVSQLASNVSAADLKTFFSPFGQVISVKVVARAQNKGERFAFIVMGTCDQTKKAVQFLNGSELKGRAVTVEIAKSSPFSVGDNKLKQKTTKTAPAVDILKASTTVDSHSKLVNPEDASSSKTAISNEKEGSRTHSSSGSHAAGLKSTGSEGRSTGSRVTKDSRRVETVASRRIVSVESNDGKKELYTTRKREERRGRSRSPNYRSRKVSPRSRIVSHRLSPSRKVSPRRRPSPPRRLSPSPRRLSPRSRRSLPHHRLGSSPPPLPMRHDVIARDVHQRLGGRMIDSHEIDLRFQQERQRLISDREREREALRREMRIEQARKEQELFRQMRELQERESRGRDAFERQQQELQQLQKTFRDRETRLEEREREIKARELRSREQVNAFERQREKEMREKIREEFQQSMKEKEIREQRDRKHLMEQMNQLRSQEKILMEKEQKLKEQEEKIEKYKEEIGRRQKDEEERKERERRKEEEERKEKESKVRPVKRSFDNEEQSVFGRLGGRDSHISLMGPSSSYNTDVQMRPSPAVVKESHISTNLTYRRYESPKSAANRFPVTNPYSQNQSRGKGFDSSFTSLPDPGKPLSYPQPQFRFSAGNVGQYSSDAANVGYGNAGTNSISSVSPYINNPQMTKSMNKILMNNPELISRVFGSVTRGSGACMQQSASPVAPPHSIDAERFGRRLPPPNTMRGTLYDKRV